MRFRSGNALAVATLAVLLTGSAAHVHAGELGFLEMLFGVRPAPPVQASQEVARSYPRRKVGAARHRLRTQFTALPVRIRANHLQTPLDMKQGAAAAFMRDETLRPGDIVVLNTGARVFTGNPDKRHTMSDFEPVQRSPYVDNATRKLLAGKMTPADEARRVVGRTRNAIAPSFPVTTQATAMRVINPWQTNP